MSLIIRATHVTLQAEATRLEARRAALQQELAQLDGVLPPLRLLLEKLGPLDHPTLPLAPPVPPVPTEKPRESAIASPPTPPKKPTVPASPAFTTEYTSQGPWEPPTPTRQSAAPPKPTPSPMAPPTSPPATPTPPAPPPTPATVGGPGTARPGPGKPAPWTRKKTPHDFLPPFHTTRSVILKWVIGESEVTTLQMGRRFPGKEPNLLRKFYDRGILERALVPGETRVYRYRAPADVKDAFIRDFNREYRE